MFRKQLPRWYDIFDEIEDKALRAAFVHNIERALDDPDDASAMQAFAAWEKELEGLDIAAWQFVKAKASRNLILKDIILEDPMSRRWQPLFDKLKEARAYNHLSSIGCSNVRFIPESKNKTPDLEGFLNSLKVLCEVKTINISDKEVAVRHNFTTVENGEIDLRATFFSVKFGPAIEIAKAQLQSYDPNGEAKHLVYINIHFDDFLGVHIERYSRQIDQHLLANPVSGVEVVCRIEGAVLHQGLTISAAAIVNQN